MRLEHAGMMVGSEIECRHSLAISKETWRIREGKSTVSMLACLNTTWIELVDYRLWLQGVISVAATAQVLFTDLASFLPPLVLRNTLFHVARDQRDIDLSPSPILAMEWHRLGSSW